MSVIRWIDGTETQSVADQLRNRPGKWAVVAESVPPQSISARIYDLRLAGDEFETQSHPCDDGPCDELYEIEARYIRHGQEVAINERTGDLPHPPMAAG